MGGAPAFRVAYLQQQDWIIAPTLLLMALTHERTLGFTKSEAILLGHLKNAKNQIDFPVKTISSYP